MSGIIRNTGTSLQLVETFIMEMHVNAVHTWNWDKTLKCFFMSVARISSTVVDRSASLLWVGRFCMAITVSHPD